MLSRILPRIRDSGTGGEKRKAEKEREALVENARGFLARIHASVGAARRRRTQHKSFQL